MNWNQTDKKGNIKGQWRDYWPNMQLKETGFYHKGLPHGTFTGYHPNGQKWYEIKWRLGKEHGLAQMWDPQGNLVEELQFEEGETLKEWYCSPPWEMPEHYLNKR